MAKRPQTTRRIAEPGASGAPAPAEDPRPPELPAVPAALIAWVETNLQRVAAAQAVIETRVGARLMEDAASVVPESVAALFARGRELFDPHVAAVTTVRAAEAALERAVSALDDARADHAALTKVRESALNELAVSSRQRAEHVMSVHQPQIAALDPASLPAKVRPVQALAERLESAERALAEVVEDDSGASKRRLFGRKGDGKAELVSERDGAAREARRLIIALGGEAPLLEHTAAGCPECESLRGNLTRADEALKTADTALRAVDLDELELRAGAAQRAREKSEIAAAKADAEWTATAPQVGRVWLEAQREQAAPMAHEDDAAWRHGHTELRRLQGYADALTLDLRSTQAEAARAAIAKLEGIVVDCRKAGGELHKQLFEADQTLAQTLGAYAERQAAVAKAAAAADEAGRALEAEAAESHRRRLDESNQTATALVEQLVATTEASQAAARATAAELNAEAQVEADTYRDRLADARRDAEAAMLKMAAQRDEARRDGDAVAASVRAESEAMHQAQRERLAAAITELTAAADAARAAVDGTAETLAATAAASSRAHTEKLAAMEAAAAAALTEFATVRDEFVTEGAKSAAAVRKDAAKAAKTAAADIEQAAKARAAFLADSRSSIDTAAQDAAEALDRISQHREAGAAAMAAHTTAAAEGHAERIKALEAAANAALERIAAKRRALLDDTP